jgi:LacI family transcriptional regulator
MTFRRVALRTVELRPFPDLVRGFLQYATEQGNWFVTLEDNAPDFLARTGCQGLVGNLSEPQRRLSYEALGIPLVHVLGGDPGSKMPQVVVDDRKVGAAALEHLAERGFRAVHFVTTSDPRSGGFARPRLEGLQASAAKAGIAVSSHLVSTAQTEADAAACEAFLRALPKPCAVVADHDLTAHALAWSCHHADIAVPEAVAILGVNDDPIWCATSIPPLSSVAIPWFRIGYEAAHLLDRQMRGEALCRFRLSIAPTGVTPRRSTDCIREDDPLVAAALALIRGHAGGALNVAAVAHRLNVTPRALQMHFRRAGRGGVLDAINARRFGTALDLLLGSALSIADIAARSGFSSPQHLIRVFRQRAGATPSVFRHTRRQSWTSAAPGQPR